VRTAGAGRQPPWVSSPGRGARIDHAAHSNDAAGLLWEQLEFDDALGTCLEYQRRRPHTLIVVTSDHGNSNPGLNGMGAEYSRSNQCFAKLAAFRASHQELARRLGGKAEYSGIQRASVDIASISPERASAIVADATGITLTRDELDCLCAALSKSRRVSPADQQNNLEGTLGAVLGNHSGIGWTGTTHTSDYTVLTALGPGAAEFAGLLPNTEVFAILTHLPGIRFVNGTSTPDAAVLAAASREPSSRPHWV